MSSSPREIASRSRGLPPTGGRLAPSSHTRHTSIARLSSPVPSNPQARSPPVQQIPTPSQIAPDKQADLPAIGDHASRPGPGHSTLAAALARGKDRRSSRVDIPSGPGTSIITAGLGAHDRLPRSNYGSIDTRELPGSPATSENPDIVRRHLVQPEDVSGRAEGSSRQSVRRTGQTADSDEFSSLKLQGGDITRNIYRYAEGRESGSGPRVKRSASFDVSRPEPESKVLDIHDIRVPGGFRRNFLRRVADDPESSLRIPQHHQTLNPPSQPVPVVGMPKLFTNNFYEFLTLYGHFAGEELEEDDEVLGPDEYLSSSDAWEGPADYEDDGSEREPGEGSALLTPGTPGRRKRKHRERVTGNTSSYGAVLLLLKSFVGTGILFLPRAYLNGGMIFSILVLIGVASLSYYCFILLVNTRLKVDGSFGDIGGTLYGKPMRSLILSSIVISQIGFVAAYIVFTSENLQAFILAVSHCRTYIDIKWMVLMQLIIFLPLSLVRDISKLGFTALIADAFIMLGLLYLYYYDIATIVRQDGVSDIKAFNPSTWTLFIGTAIFTFEGVGMIIPIQESMKRPQNFPGVLAIVMVIITVLFVSMGALSYAAYGSRTQTVVLLNLPQDDKLVNAVQFLYSLAIVLSTPLQLFPATRIMENALFSRSGKYSPWIKWQKNVFRFFLVIGCAMIAWAGASDLDKFVALVGSFACVPLVYVYPPLLHLKAVARTRWQRIADYVLCGFGIVGCIYTTTLTIQQWAGGPATEGPEH